ncbi:hypothetical protein C5L39_10165 [Corynebacterium alimapuense]|uniref:Uncharacterized protein n=2 Tax=Corynebacterium alimapuense TaxID=1576874 RepID=A0A3M8K5S3_9CORY|nr:hypothetical protein C5L39_10165 [Corynebacterium alimapuense]
MIAVVDKQPSVTVVWHVQTGFDTPSASGVLSGAWIVGPGEVDPDRLSDLTAGAVVVPTDGSGLTPEDLRAAVCEALGEIKAAADQAKQANPKLTVPRFEEPVAVDVEKFFSVYRGEEVGQKAWAYAMTVAELVESWQAIEARRRSRKFLQERFGTETRPLPLP